MNESKIKYNFFVRLFADFSHPGIINPNVSLFQYFKLSPDLVFRKLLKIYFIYEIKIIISA